MKYYYSISNIWANSALIVWPESAPESKLTIVISGFKKHDGTKDEERLIAQLKGMFNHDSVEVEEHVEE